LSAHANRWRGTRLAQRYVRLRVACGSSAASHASQTPERIVKKAIVIGVAVLVLAGGGAGGWWWFSQRAQAAAAGGEQKKPAPPAETAVVALDPFLVNLADTEASRFLRTTIELVVDDKELAEAFGAKGEHGDAHAVDKVRLRSAILELLTTQTSERLVTSEGKAELKKAIAERAGHVLEGAKVVDVLFTDFVVQF
jgi:flagellar FliL protein